MSHFTTMQTTKPTRTAVMIARETVAIIDRDGDDYRVTKTTQNPRKDVYVFSPSYASFASAQRDVERAYRLGHIVGVRAF